MPEVTISPSLFIGLGTTGWKMVDELRKLIYEEFGRAGLPCFRYAALETDLGYSGDNGFLPNKPEAHESVRPLYITIPNLDVVKTRIDRRSGADYCPGLADWVDPTLLDRGPKSFEAGAGHMRQAGRLCLWENWNRKGNIAGELRALIAELRAQRNIDDADAFLRSDYLKRKGIENIPHDSLVSAAPKVYILGTFCGGTCSGTFLDIAYFMGQALGIGAANNLRRQQEPEVVGIFTVPDALWVRGGNDANVASCWAALRELDYYTQPQTVYSVRLPDNTRVHTQDPPFSSVYLESLSNTGKASFGANHGALVEMCAMNLFTEVVAGMAACKSTIRVNFRAGDAGYLSQNRQGAIRAFSSFGLSAIWYPKYRIARAISRQLAVAMCDAWLDSPNFNQSNAQKDAEILWKRIGGRAAGSLIGAVDRSQCTTPLEADIKGAFEDKGSITKWNNQSPPTFKTFLASFPAPGNTFVDRFRAPDGAYYTRVNNAEPGVSHEAASEIKLAITDYLKDHTVQETVALLAELKKLLQALEAKSQDLPVPSQSIDTSLADEVASDKWTMLLLQRPASVSQYKESLWLSLQDRVVTHLHKVKDHVLRRVIATVLRELASFELRLRTVATAITALRDRASAQAAELIKVEYPTNIIIVANNDANDIKVDVDLGRAEVLSRHDARALRTSFLGGRSAFDRLEGQTLLKILADIDAAFTPLAQQTIRGFKIGEKAVNSLQNRIGVLVTSSLPYIEHLPGFEPIRTPQPPNFLFCHDSAAGDALAGLSRTHIVGQGFKPEMSPLDHFVFFYQELPGLSIADLSLAEAGAEALSRKEGETGRMATLFSHRLGEIRFDVKKRSEAIEMLNWITAMRHIVPAKFMGDEANSYYEILDGTNYTRVPVSDDAGIDEFIQRRGAAVVLNAFKKELHNLSEARVREIMTAQLRKIADNKEMERIQAIQEQMLEAAFRAAQS